MHLSAKTKTEINGLENEVKTEKLKYKSMNINKTKLKNYYEM